MIIIRRAFHFSSLQLPIYDSQLGVSTDIIYLGEESSEIVHVSWKLSKAANMIDWIGLFDENERNPMNYLDHKGRGVVGSTEGTVEWNIMRANLPKSVIGIYFGYVDGITGIVLAKSPTIRITKRANLLVHDISYYFHDKSASSDILRLTLAGCSTSHHLPENRKSISINSRFALFGNSTLEIDVGKTRCTIPTQEIDLLSGELCLAVQTDQRHSFTVVLTVSVEPMSTENISSLRPLSKRKNNFGMRESLVSASSSGSSMSQISSSGSMQLVNSNLLPQVWESRMDSRGRTFYLDHIAKRTTWQKPIVEDRRDIEATKRYSMSRRTIGTSPLCTSIHGPTQFLQRPDFISLLHENQAALLAYNSSPVVKHIIHRIRKGGEPSEKYENNRDFVAFVNMFADDTQPLPLNWQASGRNPTVFIDHTSRRTTLIDPRLPSVSASDKKRGRSAPPTRRPNVDGNGNLLNIVNRTEEIANIVEKRLPELAPKIKKKLRLIERLGHVALARLANDVDLILAISILDADEPITTSELEEKLNHFYSSLNRSGYGIGPQKVKLRFSRSNLLRDAFDQILSTDSQTLRKARLSIIFDDEEGLDYGGPSRELFFLLSRELFNPCYGLFEYSSADQYTVQISSMSSFVEHELQWMELAGRVLGLALLHRCLIDTFFTRTFYKMLLEQPITVHDLEYVDNEFYRSIIWIRENPIDLSLGMSFLVTQDNDGVVVEKELLPNGADLPVTDLNKEEFISLIVKWRVERGIERQTKALIRGLHQIIDRDFLRVFTVDQLELVLSGSIEINLDDWRNNTEYRGGYYDEHVLIEWFWATVEDMTNGNRLKLLQFVTGTSSIPFEGFSMLRGSNGSKRFTIEKWGDEGSLPRAHTCFNRLDLPCYPTRHILKTKLFMAITEGINYAIE